MRALFSTPPPPAVSPPPRPAMSRAPQPTKHARRIAATGSGEVAHGVESGTPYDAVPALSLPLARSARRAA
jgi:hypothetical protein